MPATIRDVAKKAGVSLGTVSRYLNGYLLREENRKKIEKAIQELGFKENMIAKGLKNNRSMTIGVAIGSLTDIFSTSIVTAIENTAAKHNYSIMLCDYQGSLEKLGQKLMFLKDRSIDGLILFNVSQRVPVLDEYVKEGIPIVAMDCPIAGLTTDQVIVDNAFASFQAVENLIEHGHRKISIIAGHEGIYSSDERLRGYLEALKTYGISPQEEWVRYGRFSNSGGYRAAKEILQGEEYPTALYVTNYYMMLGAMMAVYELNIKVPEQLSIIGFDHFELSDVIKPALTVIEQPIEKMGEAAAMLVLKRIKEDYTDFPITCKLSTHMLTRESVRRI